MKKIFSFLVSLILIFSTLTLTASAEEDFKMKSFDKAYITFVFDDNRMPFTKECYELFKSFDMPMCCAVIASKAENDSDLVSLLKKIEKSGGEILSHTYDHSVFVEGTTVETFEYQLGKSFAALRKLGFNVNGVIETGNGGGEKLADYKKMETVTRKYYKYSNAYGVSSQYNKARIWFFSHSVDSIKIQIDNAIANKQWIVLSAHDFNEISKENLKEVLNYIKSKGKSNVEVVNWNYIYTNFGEYSGPQVPTAQALKEAKNYKKPSQNVPNNNESPEIDNNGNSSSNDDGNNQNASNTPSFNYTPNENQNSANQQQNSANVSNADSASGGGLSKGAIIAIIVAATVLVCAGVIFLIIKLMLK